MYMYMYSTVHVDVRPHVVPVRRMIVYINKFGRLELRRLRQPAAFNTNRNRSLFVLVLFIVTNNNSQSQSKANNRMLVEFVLS